MYKPFKAETQRLMGMMTDSIYTRKDIFLREIISNASDALDKLCFTALTNQIEGHDRDKLEIRIRFEKDKRLLIVEDNGIGMNEEDLENHLGVIARSGTSDFVAAQKEEGDETASLIGQFGIGFYSAFMVSDRVIVRTRKYDSLMGYEWRSEGAEGYEIVPCEVEKTGTSVMMHIREDGEEKDEFDKYLREYPVYKIIKEYSDYVRWPIRMYMPHPELIPGCDPKAPEYTEKFEYETVNSMCPIWKRKRSEVNDKEYAGFYENHFKDKTEPLKVITASVDGNVSYDALLFIPASKSTDYGSDSYKSGLELYSGGVKIMDHCEVLLPDHYNFIRGILETNDINLNVSREMLQHDRQLHMISQSIEKKIRSELLKMMADQRETYERFFMVFGRHIKACAMEDFGALKGKLEDLIMFVSCRENKLVTLKEYADAMLPDQKYIYYAATNDALEAMKLPQTEILRDKGYDILCFADKVDELTVQMFGNYHDIRFKSAVNGEADDGLKNQRPVKADEETMLTFIKATLGDRIDDVRLSDRLRNHPVMLISGDGITFEMEQYFKSIRPDAPVKAKRILEINPDHEAFEKLKNAIAADKERAIKYAEVLYQQGRMTAGLKVEDPMGYTDLILSLWQ